MSAFTSSSDRNMCYNMPCTFTVESCRQELKSADKYNNKILRCNFKLFVDPKHYFSMRQEDVLGTRSLIK